jgi:hypothetical protein
MSEIPGLRGVPVSSQAEDGVPKTKTKLAAANDAARVKRYIQSHYSAASGPKPDACDVMGASRTAFRLAWPSPPKYPGFVTAPRSRRTCGG